MRTTKNRPPNFWKPPYRAPLKEEVRVPVAVGVDIRQV